ncbi:hypothetical protein [Paraburkholderia bannensis]|uniref:hypothetical protein n=1 Tax=Paraburkholderia bannensis TaxID=765414 RepID=UPI002AC360F5|nr:hypothetical protein [Paraburkholderia bannensis]
MRMQISRITNLSLDGSSPNSPEFEMSGVLSEWLFSIDFWRKFNSENGTMFDQFEEDEADVSVVRNLAAALTKLTASVEDSERDVLEFAFRRLPDGTVITAKATKESLLEELKSLTQFLDASAVLKTTLLLSL